MVEEAKRISDEQKLAFEAEMERLRKEEEDSKRLIAKNEAEALLKRLKMQLKELELAEQRRLYDLERGAVDTDTAAFGDIELMGISEQELDNQCDELFQDTPIEFQPRKNNCLDLEIAKLIEAQNIKIPIIHIKDQLYLIGHRRINADIKREEVLLRIGGGYEKFSIHLP